MKLLKIIPLIIIILIVHLIYKNNNYKNISYLSIGDLSLYNNKYRMTYTYNMYLKDYLKEKNKLNNYYSYYKKDLTINDTLNAIKLNKKIKSIGLKRILRESSIITITIGNSDLILEDNINGIYEEEKTVNYTFNKYKKLIKEMKKYNSNIYIVGSNIKYKNLTDKLNEKLREYYKEKYIGENTSKSIYNELRYQIVNEK